MRETRESYIDDVVIIAGVRVSMEIEVKQDDRRLCDHNIRAVYTVLNSGADCETPAIDISI